MLHIKYLLKRGRCFFISKIYFKLFFQLPSLMNFYLTVWFDQKQYKKLRLLVFILLNILTSIDIFLLKKHTHFFFNVRISLCFIFNFIYLYLSNVDITLRQFFFNNGIGILEIFLVSNLFPIVPELDIFFEHVMHLLIFIEET